MCISMTAMRIWFATLAASTSPPITLLLFSPPKLSPNLKTSTFYTNPISFSFHLLLCPHTLKCTLTCSIPCTLSCSIPLNNLNAHFPLHLWYTYVYTSQYTTIVQLLYYCSSYVRFPAALVFPAPSVVWFVSVGLLRLHAGHGCHTGHAACCRPAVKRVPVHSKPDWLRERSSLSPGTTHSPTSSTPRHTPDHRCGSTAAAQLFH